jgi:glucokinase
MSYRLGIDLGGTSAKIALVGPGHKIIREGAVVTTGFPSAGLLVKKMALVCAELLRGKKAASLGIGVAGDIDSDRGVIRVSPNLGWKNLPLKKLFQKYVRIPVFVENDANAAAWGLYNLQAPKSARNVIVMTLGTGVGGGIILDGKLYRGSTGSAGEVGHMNIEENGPLCNCGNRGCLETYVGGPHLIKQVRAALGNGQKSSLQKIFQADPDSLTPLAFAQAANAGDEYAQSIWDGVGRALGIAIGDLIYILNPQMIFFTGGIAQAGDLILKPLHATLNQRAFKTPIEAVKIKVAAEASHIGVIGASLL